MKKKIIIGALAVFAVILAYSVFSSDESEVSVRTKKAMSEEYKLKKNYKLKDLKLLVIKILKLL